MSDIKPGIKTTEFWLTVATHAAWVVAVVLHRDVSAYVPAVAIGLSAVATVAYAVSRANLKRPRSVADVIADARALGAALGPDLTGVAVELRAAVDALHAAKKPPPAKT